METKVAVSFSYSFGVLDKHLQMHFLFAYLICASLAAQASASTLQMNTWAVCDGTCAWSLSGSLCPGSSWCHFPTFCCCDTQMQQAKGCPIQSLLLSNEPDNFIAREFTCCHPLQTSLYTYMLCWWLIKITVYEWITGVVSFIQFVNLQSK